ncbi:MAG: FHA domain-containing protein [Deltaproteobacteria bacterium]|nr:FHA domain-containing protein [Deltaproteobacteria bacterium]
MIRLTAVIELEGHAPRALTHEFNQRSFTVGRDGSADFQVPLSTISRQHARIIESDGVYVIEDLGSTHGTLVNGKKLTKGEKKVLKDGDIIELTKAKVTCNIEAQKLVSAEPGEGTQAIAARAVQGILGRLGDAKGEGPYLRVLNGADEGVRFPFAGTLTEWNLGRSKECEFILNDPNVSRRHATVKKDWSGFVVVDLGSKNGVLVNDKPIKKPRRLKDRDELTVGPVKLVFIDPDAGLMDALKDVPGFEVEESVEVEGLTNEPSHMGAPGSADGGEPILGPDGQPLPPAAADPGAAAQNPTPMPAEPEEHFDDIDPALLAVDKQVLPVEWIFVGVGVVVLIIAALLLALFL